MTVLVTGASGTLGSNLIKKFEENNIPSKGYSHQDSLSSICWDEISTIINCAAVLPSSTATKEKYLSGNVYFLERLLAYTQGKHLIHFSSLSELYKCEDYQVSKMIGNSVLLANSHTYEKLTTFPLPTLEDASLIKTIVTKASNGENPIVDELVYNFMSVDAVVSYVYGYVVGHEDHRISRKFQVRNLYEQVSSLVNHKSIQKGKFIDRALLKDDVYATSTSLTSDFVERLKKRC